MPRTAGSKNVTPFVDRRKIPSTSSPHVKHISGANRSPLDAFKECLINQQNFIIWMSERHALLSRTVQSNIGTTNKRGRPAGPHEPTFAKYKWYAQHLTLLEAINNFELFYKRTLIGLGEQIQDYIPLDRVKGQIDPKAVWNYRGTVSIPALIFESQLFHGLDAVDDAIKLLVDRRRYNVNDTKGPLSNRVRCLRAVFQVRHTLSHNAGVLTVSDLAKFNVLGFTGVDTEVIDPSQDHFAVAINRLLLTEATEFTDWLRQATISMLQPIEPVRSDLEQPLRLLLGGTATEWSVIKWA